MAEQQADLTEKARNEEALRLAAVSGLDAGCRFIEAAGDPLAVAKAYNDFSKALYRQNRDVPSMIAAGQRGIQFALDQAARHEKDAPAMAAALKQVAKAISFNVGTNTWPGWGDEGIHISRDQQEVGAEAAMLSLRLMDELNLGPAQRGTSYWLVGAHHIAARDPQAALRALDEASNAFTAAGDRPSALMARGYCALAQKLCTETRAAGLATLDRVLHDLEQEGSNSARFYKRQLVTADEILCGLE
jgi:hypothetical protein